MLSRINASTLVASLALLSIAITSGCTAYATPGRGADMSVMRGGQPQRLTPDVQRANTEPSIAKAMDKRPMAQFPTAIAVARVQASGYRSYTNQGYGSGRYSVVLTRDIEKPQQIERLARLPLINGIAPIGKLLLDPNLESDQPLRRAAGELHADMLLIYTLDTTVTDEDKVIPLSLVTLGLSPNRQVRVNCTASALLLDTRNGYVYGTAEASQFTKRMTNLWQTNTAIDETRRDTESQAFGKLVDELDSTWHKVLAIYAAPAATARQ